MKMDSDEQLVKKNQTSPTSVGAGNETAAANKLVSKAKVVETEGGSAKPAAYNKEKNKQSNTASDEKPPASSAAAGETSNKNENNSPAAEKTEKSAVSAETIAQNTNNHVEKTTKAVADKEQPKQQPKKTTATVASVSCEAKSSEASQEGGAKSDDSQASSTQYPKPPTPTAKIEPAKQQSQPEDAQNTSAAVIARKPEKSDDTRADKALAVSCVTASASDTPTSESAASTSSSSSSPESETQLSALVESTSKAATAGKMSAGTKATTTTTKAATGSGSGGAGKRVVQPINLVVNGTIPKPAGKPLMAAMNQKLNKSTRTTRPRRQKASVAMYESEISDNKIGIKLCIKKSDANVATAVAAALAANVSASVALKSVSVAKPSSTGTGTGAKQTRKRSRKSKTRPLESDESEQETRRKKERAPQQSGSGTERQKKNVSFSGVNERAETKEAIEQTAWGARMPEEVLSQIFKIVVSREGCLPTLFRLGRVCSLWRRVSLSPLLWSALDLSTWIKEKYRTELKLKWFVDNRCSFCTDLNVSNWKVSDINCFLAKLAKGCTNLTGITLAGWKGFTSDHLAYLVEHMKKLERLDLSSVNVEMNASKSAVGVQSLCSALQTMGERLTHLHLAHNRLAGIPQIVNILSTHCPNLLLLDLSNVTTQATSHGILHIEKLQHGCKKLKVLRVTNSHVTLSSATMQEMMDSPGFSDLEELSIAALTDESRIIGDEHLQRILKASSKLRLLDVRGCTRLTHESLIRLPAWDIRHLYLSFCSVTRDVSSGLELIASKWAHSLIELDLAWANVQQSLDNALRALAEKGSESPLAHLNLCGSSVSDEAVKDILANCAHMSSINLSSCRGLPRGVKRLMQGAQDLQELREVLKVQMKVKLPAQLKLEAEEQQQREKLKELETETTKETAQEKQRPTATVTRMEVDDGGGGGDADGDGSAESRNSQSN